VEGVCSIIRGIPPPRIEENFMSTTAEYAVTGMTCGHCEMSVREEVSEIAGLTVVDVSASAGKLVVAAEAPIDDAAVIAAVEEAGYQASRA
jgi:copper chaperone